MEEIQHHVFRDVRSKVCIDLLRLERDLSKRRQAVVLIDIGPCNLALAVLLEELAGAVHGSHRVVGIESLLKDGARIGAHADPLCGLADIGAVEGCGLEQHRVDMIGDHRILAAHDAGDADRTVRVIDHEDVVVELSLLTVEGREDLAILSASYDDLSAVNRVIVIGMHRLAVLHHDKVCDVDQVVDGADAEVCQTALHPAGRRADLHIGDNRSNIPRAQILCLNVNGDEILRVLVKSMLHSNLWHDKRLSESHGRLSCNTEHAVAVNTVRGDLIVKVRIVKSQGFHRIGAKLQILCLVLREDIDAVLRCLRIHVPCRTELLDAAHHTDRGKASHLAGLDLDAICRHRAAVMAAGNSPAVQAGRNHIAYFQVLGARHDLNRIFCSPLKAVGFCGVIALIGRADVDRADPQTVRIRVMLDRIHAADHDLLAVVVESCPSLHLGSGEGHSVIVFLIRAGKLRHVVLDPRKWCIHVLIVLSKRYLLRTASGNEYRSHKADACHRFRT